MRDIFAAIEQVCNETHLPFVEAKFGNVGVDALFQIMRAAQQLYRHIEPERVEGEIVIYQLVETPSKGETDQRAQLVDFSSLATLAIKDLVLEVEPDGSILRAALGSRTLEDIASVGVVYRWREGQEEFLAGTDRRTVVRLDPSSLSQFAVPTLSNLREALERYATDNVRHSTCHILKDVWYDPNRLFFKAGPEETIRRSLEQFLRNRLGADHDVWPEQNVDESHPVDIRVMPRFANNRIMLIEIKWLGFSAATDGHVTARHSARRANEGCDQLADYLDEQQQSAPTSVIHGYYVIIDGRRRGLKEGDTTISTDDGRYFEDEDIEFDNAYHETRTDYDPPYRMFARPICLK